MNIFFVKSKNSKKSIIGSLVLSLVPLLIYGFYKNGISVYRIGLNSKIIIIRQKLLVK